MEPRPFPADHLNALLYSAQGASPDRSRYTTEYVSCQEVLLTPHSATIRPAECKLSLKVDICAAQASFKVLYERKPIAKKERKTCEAVVFKHKLKLDLAKAKSKVKPSMQFCDQKAMTQAMRQQAKVELKDFNKLHHENQRLYKKLQETQPSVPSHIVPPKLPVDDCRNYLAERASSPVAVNLDNIKSSIPKAEPYRRLQSAAERPHNYSKTEGTLNPKTSVPGHIVKKQQYYRVRETKKPEF